MFGSGHRFSGEPRVFGTVRATEIARRCVQLLGTRAVNLFIRTFMRDESSYIDHVNRQDRLDYSVVESINLSYINERPLEDELMSTRRRLSRRVRCRQVIQTLELVPHQQFVADQS